MKPLTKDEAMSKMKVVLALVVVLFAATSAQFALAQNQTSPPPQPGPPMHDQAMRDQFLNHWFDMVDTNKDGKISKEEWMAFQEKRFKELDSNGDGYLTKDELKSDMDKMRQRHEQKLEQQQQKKE